MSTKSKIEWTDATWNPVTGCGKVSQGCKNCYAEREWPRLTKLVPAYAGRDFTDVRTHPDRLDQPLHWKRPRRVFVNSMSDLFHESVPDEFIIEVFGTMALAKQHTFQVLTKRPARMRELLSSFDFLMGVRDYVKYEPQAVSMLWPLPNVWLGVSVEDQATAHKRIPLLLDTPAAVRWISAEPLLESVYLRGLFGLPTDDEDVRIDSLEGTFITSRYQETGTTLGSKLDWVVVGGESGPNARPMHPKWVRNLRDQCAAAGVPFMFKQWGEWAPSKTLPNDTLLAYERWCWISENGGDPDTMHHAPFKDELAHHELMGKVGKKVAGRLLDGIQHDAYPEVKP